MQLAGLGQLLGAGDVRLETFFLPLRGLPCPDEACGVDDGPRLVPVERRRDGFFLANVEIGAAGQHMRKPAMRADARKGLAKRPGRTGDQDRPRLHAAARQGLEARASVTPPRPLPPARQVQHGMFERLAASKGFGRLGEQASAEELRLGYRRRRHHSDLRVGSGASASRPFRTAPRSSLLLCLLRERVPARPRSTFRAAIEPARRACSHDGPR